MQANDSYNIETKSYMHAHITCEAFLNKQNIENNFSILFSFGYFKCTKLYWYIDILWIVYGFVKY